MATLFVAGRGDEQGANHDGRILPRGLDMTNSPNSSAHTTSPKPSAASPKDRAPHSSNSNLLTPSEFALMKQNFEQSEAELDKIFEEMIRRGELPATL